jgi:drug/metabolite transporter (DMT)-like permease
MSERHWNWHLWAGFLLCLAAFVSYPFVFAKYPITRDVPWANFLLFAVGGVLLVVGLQRAFGRPQQYRGKITGPILGVISLAALGFFCYLVFYMTKQLPPPSTALQVGQKAPEFVLPDIDNNPVALSSLLTTPLPGSQTAPKGVLLVFYRGYW